MNESRSTSGKSTVGGRRELNNTNGWFDVVELERIALEHAATARRTIEVMGGFARMRRPLILI